MLTKILIAATVLPVAYLLYHSILFHIDHGIIAAFLGA